MRNVHYFGMEDGIESLPDGAVDFSVDDIIGRDREALDENNAALERLSVIQAGLEAGLPFDMATITSELGIHSGMNRAMESFYMGDAPKKTITIALEEVDIVKVGLIAAGIAVLAAIMKKIYNWLTGGDSNSAGSGSGDSMAKFQADTDRAVKKSLEDIRKVNERLKVDPLIVESLNNYLAKPFVELDDNINALSEKFNKNIQEIEASQGGNKPKSKKETIKVSDQGVEVVIDAAVIETSDEDLYKERVTKIRKMLNSTKTSIPTRARLNTKELAIIHKDNAHLVENVSKKFRASLQSTLDICHEYDKTIKGNIKPKVDAAIKILGNNEAGVVKAEWQHVFDLIEPLETSFAKCNELTEDAEKDLAELNSAEFKGGSDLNEVILGVERMGSQIYQMSTMIKTENRIAIANVIDSFTDVLELIEDKLKNAKNASLSHDEVAELSKLKTALNQIVSGFHKAIATMRKMTIVIRRGMRVIKNIAEVMYETVRAVVSNYGVEQNKLPAVEEIASLYKDISVNLGWATMSRTFKMMAPKH